jgi:hypothetical protein
MKPSTGRLKRVFIIAAVSLVLVAFAGLIGLLVLYTKLVTPAEPAGVAAPNTLDAREATKKLKLFEEARKANRSGFVRLSEEEFNSILHERYLSNPPKEIGTNAAADCRLLRARLTLRTNAVTWHTWVRKTVSRWTRDVAWQRTVKLKRAANQWSFEVEAMQVGSLRIPPKYWPLVQDWLGKADEQLSEPYRWLLSLPAVDIQTNEVNRSLELRFYTEPNVLKATSG